MSAHDMGAALPIRRADQEHVYGNIPVNISEHTDNVRPGNHSVRENVEWT